MAVTAQDVQALYIAYFNRPADFLGLSFQLDQANKFGLKQVADQFAKSPEYLTTYANKSTAEVIDTIYMNLFGRHAEPDGIKFWGNLLLNGTVTMGNVALNIFNGAINGDKTTVQNKLSAAQSFYNSLDTSAEIVGYSGDAANGILKSWLAGITDTASLTAATTDAALLAVSTAATAAHDGINSTTFTLTTGIDTLVGTSGNDTFVATPSATNADTFSALDKLDGGAGNDTMTIAAAGALTLPVGTTVKNIETATLASSSTVTANVSTWAGLNTLNVTGGGASTVTASATTDVNELASVNTSSITGGKNVTVVHATAGNVTVADASGTVDVTSTLAGGTVTVTQANATPTAITISAKGNIVAGGSSLNASINGATSFATQVADLAAKSAAALTASSAAGAASDAATVVTHLNTMAATVAAATTIDANNAATLTAYLNGEITQAQKTAIDSAFAKALTATGGTAALAQAAALAVETPILAAANAASVTANTASSAAAAASTAAAAVVTTDASAAAYSVTDNASKVLASATVSGNYTGSTVIADGSAGNNVLTTVSLENAGSATLTGNALTNVSVANDPSKNVTINNNTVGHTQNLTLTDVGTRTSSTVTAPITISDAAAKTVTIASKGAENLVNLSAAQATSVVVTGSGKFTLGTGSTLANNAVIDARASTAANSATISAAQSYLGGTGADTVTVGSVLQSAAVNGGTGTADKLVVTDTAAIVVNTLGTGSAEFTGFEILDNSSSSTIDLSTTLTGNTFTSVVLHNATAGVTGLTAAQAGNVTVSTAGAGLVIGVAGATTVGQLDAVTVNAGAALGALSIAGVETLNINATAATSFDMANAMALTNINVTGSKAVGITTGSIALNVNTIIDAHLSTGSVNVNAGGSTANGLKIIGSATADNVLISNGLNSVLTGGNGNNVLTGGAGNDTITGGNGNNTISAGNGTNTVTVGNGVNVITAGAGADTITTGTGVNFITTGAGLDSITVGAHTIGTIDTFDIGNAATAATAANSKVITGFVSGTDRINLATGAATLNGLTLAATSTQAAMLAVVSDTTSVASLTDVYTALVADLNNTTGREFAVSSAAAGGIVAREVTFTTGAAAGTYLVINDSVAGFQAANDIVIQLKGNTIVAAGDIVVGGVAPSVAPALSYTLSTGVDTLTGGSLGDTFNALFSGSTAGANAANNWQSATDVLQGGSGTDTLVLNQVSGGGALTLIDSDFTAARTGSIENLQINSTTTNNQSITVANAGWEAAGFNKLTTTSTTGAITIAAAGTAAADTFVATSTSGAISITGGNGGDTITATSTLTGGNLTLVGGTGVDTITANNAVGSATITGGAGSDIITLGAHTGADTLVLNSLTGADTVTGYAVATDVINLSLATFANLTGTAGAVTLGADFVAVANAAALTSGSVGASTNAEHIIYLQDTGALYYNGDGATAGGLTLIATLVGMPVLVAGEFTIIA